MSIINHEQLKVKEGLNGALKLLVFVALYELIKPLVRKALDWIIVRVRNG